MKPSRVDLHMSSQGLSAMPLMMLDALLFLNGRARNAKPAKPPACLEALDTMLESRLDPDS